MTKGRQQADGPSLRSNPLPQWGDEGASLGDRGPPYIGLPADDAAPAGLGHPEAEQEAPQRRGHPGPDPAPVSALQPGDGLPQPRSAGRARSRQGDPDPGPRLP